MPDAPKYASMSDMEHGQEQQEGRTWARTKAQAWKWEHAFPIAALFRGVLLYLHEQSVNATHDFYMHCSRR